MQPKQPKEHKEFLAALTPGGNRRVQCEGGKGRRVGDTVCVKRNSHGKWRIRKLSDVWGVAAIVALRYYTLNNRWKNYHARVRIVHKEKLGDQTTTLLSKEFSVQM